MNQISTLYKCVVCGRVWHECECFSDPRLPTGQLTCGDLTCGANVRPVVKEMNTSRDQSTDIERSGDEK